MKKTIGVVGAGPHFLTHQYKLLERLGRSGPRFRVLVELESRRSAVEQAFANRLKPERMIWVPDHERDSATMALSITRELAELRQNGELDGLMVCTEPKAHFPYMAWACEHGIDVLVDKPLTVPPGRLSHSERSSALLDDFRKLRRLQTRSGSRVTLLVPRRAHEGYEVVRSIVKQTVEETGVPITALNVSHSGGVWNMPGEWHREAHPYKYGYGGVLHSGYHQVDLFADMMKLNGLSTELRATGAALGISTMHTVPMDVHMQEAHAYPKFFGEGHPALVPSGPFGDLGEVDVKAMLRLSNERGAFALGGIDMLQTSLSTRTSANPPTDPYKGMGRLRHESMSVSVGHLLTVTADGNRYPGQEFAFTIKVGRNQLTGPADYEVKHLADGGTVSRFGHQYHSDLTGRGHEAIALQWLEDQQTRSELEDHALSMFVLAGVHESMGQQNDQSAGRATVELGPAMVPAELTGQALNRGLAQSH